MTEIRPHALFELENSGSNSSANGSMDARLNNHPVSHDEQRISEEELLRHFPTRDEKIYKLLEIAKTIAPTKVPVLITGESGVGKETFAKAIHIAGSRDAGRFIVANCSSIPQNFFEMELFSQQRQNHRLDYNNGFETSSLLLDEVTELDASMQMKLLRILKEQDVHKGSVKRGTAMDARIIASSNRNMQDEVNAQRFRNDLFYKLHVIHIEIPPLRQRPIDVDFYSELFIREFNMQFSKNIQLSQTAKQALRTYTWPGNTRELRNILQRSILLATKDYLGVEDLHLIKANSRTELALSEHLPALTLRELEQRLILQTLRRMGGNRTHTAKALGISLRALRYKLNELVDCGFEVEGKNV